MRSLLTAAAGAAMALGMIATASAQNAATQIEAVMTEYLELWNAHDAGTITRTLYRLEGAHPWSTEAGLKAEFDRLKADGYSHSRTNGLRGCLTAPDLGQIELRFVRLRTDGTAMAPGDRASLYRLRLFEDGWKIIGMTALRAGQTMDCPGETPEAQIEAKMREYVETWNRRDAAAVVANVYRMPEGRMGTVTGLQTEFDRLRADGYSHSVLHSVRSCTTGEDTGLGEMRYTRLKTDGAFMPPEMRSTIYQLRKFDDGWRITAFGAGAVNCFETPAAP